MRRSVSATEQSDEAVVSWQTLIVVRPACSTAQPSLRSCMDTDVPKVTQG